MSRTFYFNQNQCQNSPVSVRPYVIGPQLPLLVSFYSSFAPSGLTTMAFLLFLRCRSDFYLRNLRQIFFFSLYLSLGYPETEAQGLCDIFRESSAREEKKDTEKEGDTMQGHIELASVQCNLLFDSVDCTFKQHCFWER